MPSTTNTLESMHGHLNSNTPRRNNFFSAIARSISELDSKYEKITQRIQHNYRFTMNRTLQHLQNTDPKEITKMVAFYDTKTETCLCGQNSLQSSNFKIDIPCIHRLSIGAQFTAFPQIVLILTNQYNETKIEYDISQNLYLPTQIYNEKLYIVQTIKHFSRYKDKNEIKNFVELYNENDRDGIYLNSQPIHSIQIIEEGIYHFKQIKLNNQ